MPDDMKHLFDNSVVPAPRADLSDRIMAATQNQAPLTAANDRKPWFQNAGILSAVTGIAATLVAGFFVLSSQPNEAELWAAEADAAGFGELYAWVDSDVDSNVQ